MIKKMRRVKINLKNIKDKIIVVIPAYNEEKSIGIVIDGLKKEGYKNIIVIDDGSKDKTFEIARSKDVYVFRHKLNRGLGGALGTAIEAANKMNAEIVVTFDADGQHIPTDVMRMAAPILKGEADAVIGSRLLDKNLVKGMPLVRRIGNFGFNLITFLLFGVKTTDSQSGLRAFSKKAARLIKIKTNRMEVSSEFIKEIGAHNLKLKEIAIKPVYTSYSLKKGQTNLNALKILAKLILKKLMR
ncbi:MAG: glycosyltransferase family 2 protein [Nanoarchaeota archaeon]|nr:glycosyltransferase family 2 protein [Nanoarchaeota archaeon]